MASLGLATVALAQGDLTRAAALGRTSLVVRWEERDQWGITQSLVAAAGVARASGWAAAAARLLAAVAALREATGASLSYGLRRMSEDDLAAAKAALSEAEFGKPGRRGAACRSTRR